MQSRQVHTSAIVKEVYDAFRSAGVSDEQATAAALAIPPSEELATKSEFSGFRADVTSDFSDFRADMTSDFSDFRAELKSEFADFRAEVKSEISEFRAEVRGDVVRLHSEIRELRADTRSDMKDLELRMTVKFYAAVGLAVAGIKALDFLIG